MYYVVHYDDYACRVMNKSKLGLQIEDDLSLIRIAEKLCNQAMDELTAILGLKHYQLTDIKDRERIPATQRYSYSVKPYIQLLII